MEIKKINVTLLGIFIFHLAVSLFLEYYPEPLEIGIILNLSLGQIILFVPIVIYLLLWKFGKKNREEETRSYVKRLHFNKVKPSTIAYVLIFIWLSMPLTTLINAISLLFVDNTILSLTGYMTEVPFPVMLFFMAMVPAFCEEVAFRGTVYGGYRKDGSKFWAVILSGLMFGLMHMNLNQATYAFVLGILLALLLEATDSILMTMLFHFIYNAQSCCALYLVESILPGFYSEASNMTLTNDNLYAMICVYLVIAAITTPLAICLLYKIAKNENRVEQLKETLPKKQEKRARICTVTYILSVVIAVVYITYLIVASGRA